MNRNKLKDLNKGLAKQLKLDRKGQNLDTFVRRFLLALDSPRALTVWLLYKHGEHTQLAALKHVPKDYLGVKACDDALLATSLLRKFKYLRRPPGPDMREVTARERLMATEDQCRETNRIWRNCHSFTSSESALLYYNIRRKILHVLGDDFTVEELVASSSFGPGGSQQIRMAEASTYKKFRLEAGITADAFHFVAPFWEEWYPKWHIKYFCVVPGDKVIYVPKDAETHRGIRPQPGLNLWFQKGLGAMVRRRLKSRAFLDLNTCDKERNVPLARQGSKDGTIATIDLKSASDTVALNMVRFNLPPVWFAAFDLFRTKCSYEGERWQSFAAMGNGFTFELESLIFWAIASVACEMSGLSNQDVSVFGDDITCPTEAVPLLLRALRLYGFEVNETKTFIHDDFRESCGAYFCRGLDIKPHFQKEHLSYVPKIYSTANAVDRVASRRRTRYGRDRAFRATANCLRDMVPEHLRFMVHRDFGDCGFHSDFDEAVPNCRAHVDRGLGSKDPYYGYGIEFLAMVHVPVTWEASDDALLLARLAERSDFAMNDIMVKQRTTPRVIWQYASDWLDKGPWI